MRGAWLIGIAAAVAAILLGTQPAEAQRGGEQRRPGGGAGAGAGTPMQRQATEADADALLDEGLVVDAARLEAARQRAADSPPATADANQLVRFYATRADAARVAGNSQQWLEDLREAARHLAGAADVDKVDVLLRLAGAEGNAGRRTLAVKALEEAIAHNPPNRRPRLLNIYGQLIEQQTRLGNIQAAETALAAARTVAREMQNSPRFQMNAGVRRLFAGIEGAEAMIFDFRGQYAAGEASHRRAVEELQHLDEPRDQQRKLARRQQLAMNLRAQGRLAEAENEVRQVLVESQRLLGASSPRTAGALNALAAVLADQGRAAEAESLVRKSIEILSATSPQQVNNPRQVLANTLAVQGKWREALAEFETLRQGFSRNPQGFDNLTRRNVFLPVAMLKAGRTADARARLEAMVEANKATLGEKHAVTAESRGFLAMALAAAGEPERALMEFREAASVLLARSRESSDGEDSGSASAQDQRTRLILEGYIDVLAELRSSDVPRRQGIDPVAESFRLADAAKGRSVVRALAASAARAAAANPELAGAARRVQDAEKQISALNGLLANAISARAQDQDPTAIRDLRRRIDALRDERGRLMQDIERRFPDYAKLVNPQPATVAEVQRTLRRGEAMVALLAGERRTYAWVVTPAGAPDMAAAALGRDALSAAITLLRKAVDPNAQTLDDIPVFDVATAYRLYAALLQPTEATWRGAESLFVVPDGPFGQLPLGLLVTAPTTLASADADGVPFSRYRAVPWLIRRAAVTQLPSVGSLAALRALPARTARGRAFVGFGDPWFSKEQAAEAQQASARQQTAELTTRGVRIKLRSAPKASGDYSAEYAQLPRLPDTADEVKAIAAVLRSSARDVVLGANASTTAVKRADLSDARIVMFATHGLVPGDLSGLNQPALALSAPEVTGDAADGLLTVEDILALKLNADWVVLSACNTASGQGAGAEAVSGLGRAFFYAGTRALLVSNWPVESSSARALTTDLFRRQAQDQALSRAEALRRAMLGLIDGPGLAGDDGKPVFTYAHPIFWAPFSLVGDGGANPG